MSSEEIEKVVNKIENFEGMTVNERLFVCGLMSEFDKSLINNKEKARKILELLQVDKLSIEKIIK